MIPTAHTSLDDAFHLTGHRSLVALRLLDEARRAWRTRPSAKTERAYHSAAAAAQAAGLAHQAAREAWEAAETARHRAAALDDEAAFEAAHWRAATQ